RPNTRLCPCPHPSHTPLRTHPYSAATIDDVPYPSALNLRQLRLLPIDLRSRASSPRRRTHGVNLSCPHQPALPHTPGTQVHTLSPGNHGTTAPGETPTVVNADTADTKLSPCGAVQSATYHLTAPQYWRPM